MPFLGALGPAQDHLYGDWLENLPRIQNSKWKSREGSFEELDPSRLFGALGANGQPAAPGEYQLNAPGEYHFNMPDCANNKRVVDLSLVRSYRSHDEKRAP